MRTFLVLILCIPLFIQAATSAAPAHLRIGVVAATSGTSELLRAGKGIKPGDGVPVCNNDTIRTGQGGGLSIRLINDCTLTIGPDTQAIISTELRENGQLARVALIYGRLQAEVKKSDPTHEAFSVQTASASCGVRGTVLTVAAGRAPGMLAGVLSGQLEVRAGTNAHTLRPGEQLVVSAAGDTTKPAAPLDITAWLAARSRALLADPGAFIRTMDSRVKQLELDFSAAPAGPVLDRFLFFYAKITDILNDIPPLGSLQRRLEYRLLQATAPVLYAAKAKLTALLIVDGKLKAVHALFSRRWQRRLRPVMDAAAQLFTKVRELAALLDKAETFYRIRMLLHQK